MGAGYEWKCTEHDEKCSEHDEKCSEHYQKNDENFSECSEHRTFLKIKCSEHFETLIFTEKNVLNVASKFCNQWQQCSEHLKTRVLVVF